MCARALRGVRSVERGSSRHVLPPMWWSKIGLFFFDFSSPAAVGCFIASLLSPPRAAQLGQASVDHIPRELRIMGRTILTQKGKTKWYDLPLTEQEIEHGNTVGEPALPASCDTSRRV